jgi:hypothetical protein
VAGQARDRHFADIDPDVLKDRDSSGARALFQCVVAPRDENSMRLLNLAGGERRCRSFGGTAYSIQYFQQYYPPDEVFAGLSPLLDGC